MAQHDECNYPECDREVGPKGGRGYCSTHLKQLRSVGIDGLHPIGPPVGRNQLKYRLGLVDETNTQFLCSFSLCENRRYYSFEFCRPHQRQCRRVGYERMHPIGQPRGRHRPEFTVKRNRWLKKNGYVAILDPEQDPNGYIWIYEHRWVMQQTLGRSLQPGESVHHRNGRRSDNRPENLELWSVSQPKGQRVEDLLEWAKEIIAEYEPIIERLHIA